MNELEELLHDRRLVLLDFDGPICGVFSGVPARSAAQELLGMINVPPLVLAEQNDPFRILAYAAEFRPGSAIGIESRLTEIETQAVMVADATPHAAELIHEVVDRLGATVAVVSNNSVAAVRAYLSASGLARYVAGVYARTSADISLLKPAPHLLVEALRDQRRNASDALFVGDSTTDIEAGAAAGVPTIAFANKPGKLARFIPAQPAAVITDLAELRRAFYSVNGGEAAADGGNPRNQVPRGEG